MIYTGTPGSTKGAFKTPTDEPPAELAAAEALVDELRVAEPVAANIFADEKNALLDHDSRTLQA